MVYVLWYCFDVFFSMLCFVVQGWYDYIVVVVGYCLEVVGEYGFQCFGVWQVYVGMYVQSGCYVQYFGQVYCVQVVDYCLVDVEFLFVQCEFG